MDQKFMSHMPTCIGVEQYILLRQYSGSELRINLENSAGDTMHSAKVVQQAWRAFKLRPETWVKRVWNMVRNDGTPDKKKFLDVTPRKIRVPDNWYINYIWNSSYLLVGINNGDRIQAKDMPAHYQNDPILYDHYSSQSWAEKKREQLWSD